MHSKTRRWRRAVVRVRWLRNRDCAMLAWAARGGLWIMTGTDRRGVLGLSLSGNPADLAPDFRYVLRVRLRQNQDMYTLPITGHYHARGN